MFFKRQKILVKHPVMNYYSFRWVRKFDYQKAVFVLPTVLLIFQIISGVFLFVSPPKQAQAATQTWPFTTASNYIYDNTKIEISSGQSQLKATTTPAWYNTSWQYRKKITIDHTKVSADLTNFPVFVSTRDSDIISKGQGDRDDILFTSSDGTTKLDHEIENSTSIIEYLSDWSESTDYLQGVATDGTYTYVSAKGLAYPGKLLKYTQAGSLVASTTELTNCTQIADIYYKDNYLYVADATAINDVANSTGGRIVRFNASDLSYDSVVLNEDIPGYFTEGVTFYNNNWWLGFWAGSSYPGQDIKIRKYDSSWNFVKEYSISNSSGDIQGLDFYEQAGNTYLVVTTHNEHPTEPGYVYVYKYNPSTDSFTFETKKAPTSSHSHPQGLFFENRTNGSIVWFADRVNAKISKEDFSNVISTIDMWVKIPSLSSSSDTDIYLYYGNPSASSQATTTGVWDSNYKGVWHLAEDPNAVGANDSTSNNNDGTGSTMESGDLAIGKTGLNLDFLSNDYIEVADATSLKPDYITVSAWIKTDSVDGEAIVSKTEAGGYLLSAWYPDTDYLYFTNRIDGTYYSASSSKALVNDSTWHYVVGTYDGANVQIYVDGILQDTEPKIGVIDHGDSPPALRIGAEAGDDIQNCFNGSIDEVRISDIARDSDWISTEYNNQNSPSTFYSVGSEETAYSFDNPTIQPTAADSLTFTSLSGFTETATKNGGEIKYILSNDGGSTWKYYSSGWVTSDGTYSQANTATEIDSNIATFPTGNGDFLFKTFLSSDGTQLVQLDSISLTYNNPLSVTFDNDFSTWESGNVTVNYNLIDDEGDSLNISQTVSSGIEYSTDSSTWYDATDAGGASEGLTGLTSTSTPGTGHIFVWDSATDLPNTEDSTIYLRIRPNDGTIDASSWATSTAFGIDNVAPLSVGPPTFGTITSSSIVINKPSTVTENGSGLYQWQVRRDGAVELGFNATSTTSVTDSSLSENTQYTYDVQFTDNQNNTSNYGTSTTKYTLANTPTNFSATAGINSITLSVDSFPNDSSGSSGYYFSRSGANSGWIQTNSWQDTGLSCGTSYTYTVKYRNGDGTETNTISLTQSTNSCGGGGGLPPAAYNPPTKPEATPENPEGGFRVFINDGAEKTNSREVILKLFAGPDSKRMAISNNPDFSGHGTGQITYQSLYNWDICYGQRECPDGIYTVYVKFYTQWSHSSNTISGSIVYKKEVAAPEKSRGEKLIAYEGIPAGFSFERNLSYGDKNENVKYLQIILKEEIGPPTYPEHIPGTGWFGLITKSSVIAFQEKYASGILAPWGLTEGTGYVGKTTRDKLNEILGQIAPPEKPIVELPSSEVELPAEKPITGIPGDYRFSIDLKYNQRGNNVRYLQIFLKAQGHEIYPEGIVSGWFGPLTKKAVIRFQEKYASGILAPWGLTEGTGYVGKTTRDKLNEILGR